MRRVTPAIAIAIAVGAALGFGTAVVRAGPERVPLPDDYQARFVRYLDVDRPDTMRVRRMYVNPEAHDAAEAGAPLPDGTVLIMEDHDARTDTDGRPLLDPEGRMQPLEPVVNVFVMRKDAAWRTENGNWDYAWYLPDGNPRPDASFDGCFACHASRAERDYTFTYWKFVSDAAR